MTDQAEPALELISFCIGEQEFCIDVKTVREIRGWTPATPIPHAPGFLKGVINLRGAIMPVIDLRNRLGLGVTIPEIHSQSLLLLQPFQTPNTQSSNPSILSLRR